MEIDKQGNFIGHGEYVVFDHVVQLFPEAEVKIQVKFKDLLRKVNGKIQYQVDKKKKP